MTIDKRSDGAMVVEKIMAFELHHGTVCEIVTPLKQVLTCMPNGEFSLLTCMPNGEFSLSNHSDLLAVKLYIQSKNGKGNKPEIYEMFSTLYDELTARDESLGLGFSLEEKAVIALSDAFAKFSRYGKELGGFNNNTAQVGR